MAASAATASSSPGLCPNYAVICSFLERYGALLDLPELTFPQLERYLQDTSSVPKLLVDLHVKLLRKIGKSVSADRWEKYLVKVCQDFNTTWAWELEEKGYKELSVECKTGILKYLCECQFDENVKFKTAINEEDPDKMRLQPIGRDKDGQMYWFQLDQDNNVRVYLEEQDDLDGSSWKCIVRDRNDLAEVVALLKTQIDPELLKREELKQQSKPGGEENKDDVRKSDDTSDEDSKDSTKPANTLLPKTEDKEKETQKDDLKSETSVNGKAESEIHSENTTKAHNIKEEPVEVSEGPCLSVKSERNEEVKRSTAEDIQQTIKNDQQAKIPLKKRGMKFSEDFEKSSSITVQNPSVTQVRETLNSDTIPEQTKTALNDHVNGEIQPELVKDFQSLLSDPLKDSSTYKQQNTESATGKFAVGRGNESLSADKKDRDESTEVVRSYQADLDKKDAQAEKETTESAKRDAHDSASSPTAESTPSLKDVNNADTQKSSNHEKRESTMEKLADREETCTEDKTTSSKVTDKTLTIDQSGNSQLNHEAKPKETETRDAEEKPDPVDMDTSESNQIEKTITSSASDMKEADLDKIKISGSDVKDSKVVETKATSVSDVKDSNIEQTKTSSVSDVKDLNMEESKTSVSDIKKVNVDESKTSVSDVKDLNMEESKTSSVSDIKKVNVDESKTSVSDVKDLNMEESKTSSVSDIKKVNVDESKTSESDVKDSKVEETKTTAVSDVKDSNVEQTKTSTVSDIKKVNVDESKSSESDVKDSNVEQTKTSSVSDVKDFNVKESKTSFVLEKKKANVDKAKTSRSDVKFSSVEKTKTSVSETKQADVIETGAKPMEISEINVEKSNNSQEKEVDNNTKTESVATDPEKKTDLSENTASPPVTKLTETLKDGENTDTQKVTQCSPANKNAGDLIITDESKELSNTKEALELSPIEEVNKSESCKPAEKQCNIKDEEITPKENSEPSGSDTEKTGNTDRTEKPEDTTTSVNSEDAAIHDVTKMSDSVSSLSEVEAVAVKQDLTTAQEDDKMETNCAAHETSEEKAKPSSPVEKTEVSGKSDQKEEKQDQTEVENTSSESKKDPDNEKPQKVNEEQLCGDKDTAEDPTTDKPSITDQTKEEEHKNGETSMKIDESAHENVSKDSEAKSSGEPEKPDRPSKEPEADKSTDEESKSKSGEQEKQATNRDRSDIRVVGSRQRIRLPAHRRKAELLREERQGDSESDTNVGRSLRRSPRISRPTPKAVEVHDKKSEKPQAPPAEKDEKDKEEKEDEEEDEEVLVKAVQKKPREKKPDQEGQPKPKGRKRRKIRWSNTRTRRKKKSSEDEDGNSDEESSEEEEETEEEDDSDEDYKVERSRKRRNRNRERRSSDSSTSSDDDLPPNDDPCKHCGLPNHPELILLCDSCDNGYHTACLRPPLMIIPDGEWFCPPCQHKQLCDKLEEQLQNLDAALKKKERAERRKERLIYVGISLENIITPTVEAEEEKPEIIIKEKKEVKRSKSWGRRSTRAKKTISYRFDEFDEAIEEAIEEDIKEAEGGGAGRGKDMANITGHRGKDISTILQAEEGKENGRPARPTAAQRRKKRRRLNDLDSDSTVDEEESEEEFCLSESSEEEFVVSDNESEAEVEVGSNDSDFGSNGSSRHHAPSRSRKPLQQRRSSRKRRRPRGYSDDEEEESDEDDEEDEIATEGSSEFSDSDLDMSRRRSRRSQKKQVNYCETSESEGSQAETNRPKMKHRRLQESSDSDASFSRDSEEESRVKKRVYSSEEDSRHRRRRLALKRRRASEDDDSDDDSDDSSSEEDRPIRKRVNRIDSDDDDEEEEPKPKDKKAEEESKGTNPLDCNLAELPPTNGQNPIKSLEGLITRPPATAPDLIPHLEPSKNITTTPATAIAPNGLVGQEMAAQDDDEDDLLGVTDLVDYVCNNEQL